MRIRYAVVSLSVAGVVAALSPTMAAQAAPGPDSASNDAAATAAYWTAERRAGAIPRDIVVDARGQSYLRGPSGLQPYGPPSPSLAQKVTQVGTPAPQPMARPGGGGGTGDTSPPSISGMDPTSTSQVGATYTFKATVADPDSGVRSVSFSVRKGTGAAQSFTATKGTDPDVWSVTLQGLTDGAWSWSVTAKDNAGKGGNTATSAWVPFTVVTGGSGGGGGSTGGVVVNLPYTEPGTVQSTAGRVYFEMPTNARKTRWSGYVCSGTAVNDAADDRSIIVTAAHCVYDDANKAFARNVLFIPDQDRTIGAGTDGICSNDPLGCWAPQFGVVDKNWANRSWPDNIPWDYGYYVVPETGAYTRGILDVGPSLQGAVGGQSLPFTDPAVGTPVAALGYSYSDDPNFMYCSEPLSTIDTANWWLPSCGLSGGASGGPWLATVTPDGKVFSVNSWGYSNQPGMAGPLLGTSSAKCVYDTATSPDLAPMTTPKNGGVLYEGTCP